MIISSRPGTPDRTRYILGLSDENPAPVMIDAGRWLVAEGAEILAIPCITAHYFQKQLEEEIHTPVIHLIKETVHHMRDYGVRKAVLFGSYGKGTATEKSDVDLLVDSRLRGLHFVGFLDDIQRALGKDVDLFDVSHIQPDSLIDREIRQTGVTIYEKQMTK